MRPEKKEAGRSSDSRVILCLRLPAPCVVEGSGLAADIVSDYGGGVRAGLAPASRERGSAVYERRVHTMPAGHCSVWR